MTDNSKRVSELPTTANAAQNDRLLILKSPSSNASLRTITVANLTSSMTKATELSAGVVRVGQGIAVDANGTISALGGTTVVGVVAVDNEGQDTYTVGINDSVIFVNPTVVGSNVTITLPIADAIEGKEITVKLIDADGDYKVTITTDDEGNAYLEDPVTGAFDFSYDLVQTGQAETWIHDGNVYRHLSTARATPIFNVNANTYAQVVVRNSSNGQNASADLVLYNDLGDYEAGTGPLIDLGINSSQYSNAVYSIGGHNDGYLFVDAGVTSGGNLAIGVAQDKTIIFHANGTTSDKAVMSINSTAIYLADDGDIIRNGISVIGTGQIDGGNAFTTPTAEITVDGGGA